MAIRVLITGGNGFIGSHLTGALLGRSAEVVVLCRSGEFKHNQTFPSGWEKRLTVVTGDINDFSLLEQVVGEVDVIVHNASSVGVTMAGQFARPFVDNNVGGTGTLCEALKKSRNRVRKIILGSSISVYGEGNYLCASCGWVRPRVRYASWFCAAGTGFEPPCPSCAGQIAPALTPVTASRLGESVYSITKKAQEDLATGIANLLGVQLVTMRYCTVIGEGMDRRNPYYEFLKRSAAGEPSIVCEDGLQTRDFIHVSDVVAANLAAIEKDSASHLTLNLGTGRQTSVLAFAQTLAAAMAAELGGSVPPVVTSGQLRDGDVRHCEADCSLLEQELSLTRMTPLDTTIEKTVAWFTRLPSFARRGIPAAL